MFDWCPNVSSGVAEVICWTRVYLSVVGRDAGPPPTTLCRREYLDKCRFRRLVVGGLRVAVCREAWKTEFVIQRVLLIFNGG